MSASLQRHQQFEKRRPIRLVAGILFFILYGIYLLWRIKIFNLDSIFLSSLFYIMDLIGFILGLIIIFTAYTGRPDYPDGPAPEGLNVDIFLPTYKEPVDIIRKTIEAAIAIDYPHKTFVLDDGKRPEIKEIAESLGAIYRSREKNTHAKAGNLNYGLTHSTADFIAVFDADHIPQREALDKLLAFMGDSHVAMVQTPQDFYNINALQFIDGKKDRTLWSEQSFFYSTVQVCNNKVNSTTGLGTGVAYRRQAIDEIGGIPEETITEDLHTSLRLQKAGWLTKYISEAVAYGLAAVDVTEFYTTRKRWCHGNLDAICQENVLFCKELTWRQKMAYMRVALASLEGFQQLLMGIIPPIALIFGLQPFEITSFNVLIVLFFPLLAHVLLQEFCGGRFWPSTLLSKLFFPIHIVSCAAAFGRKMLWTSSSKNIKARHNYRLLVPQISMGVINLLAVIFGVWRLYPDFKTGPILEAFLHVFTGGYVGSSFKEINFFAVLKDGYTVDLVMVAGFWALFNALSIAMLVYRSQKKVWNSEEDYLFQVELPLEFQVGESAKIYAITKRCSVNSIEFDLVGNSDDRYSLDSIFEVTLYTPSGNFPIILSSIKKRQKGGYKAEIDWVNKQDKKHFEDNLYSISWHHDLYHYQGSYETPLENFTSFFKSKKEKKIPLVKPLLLGAKNVAKKSQKFAALKPSIEDLNTYTLISFNTLNVGDKIEFEELTQEGVKYRRAEVVNEIPKEKTSFLKKNLDGTIVQHYTIAIR